MRFIYLLILLVCFSCNNERILHLPEIENAEITEVLDVSPAYIFYDETQPDSTLLNRKNLIISTNWLVNVDKRLTLRQAIPNIKFLQDKKRNAELHKNEEAKNYFTCNDNSIGNLGFIEFTDLDYILEKPKKNALDLFGLIPNDLAGKMINSDGFTKLSIKLNKTNKDIFQNEIAIFLELIDNAGSISENMKITGLLLTLNLDKNLNFQDYISIKSKLSNLDSDKIIIDSNEFIY